MGLILALFMAGSAIPAECRIAYINFTARRRFEACATEGSIGFVARYYARDGVRIYARACAISPPTWGADRVMQLNETGFRAVLTAVQREDEPVVSIAVSQGEKVFIYERAVKR